MKEVFPFFCDRCGSTVRLAGEIEDMEHQNQLMLGCRCKTIPATELGDSPPSRWMLDFDDVLDWDA